MRVLFALNHPAHYYLFKYINKGLKERGYYTKLIVREKDILKQLLISECEEFSVISKKHRRKKNAVSIIATGIFELLEQELKMFNFVRRFKPDYLLGTDIAISHVGKLFKIPSFVFNEDDFEINQLFCRAAYPFAKHIVAPDYTSVGKYSNKKISYNGIQKMAYLNKKYFVPNASILEELGLSIKDEFVIIRLVSLTSGHDIEGKHDGISIDVLAKIIRILEQKYRIYITSEDALPQKFANYQVRIKLNQMHDLMHYASLFIGDSQTMCAEAGILGTPFIRYNDFVGKIEYLNDLERNYKLGWGIRTSESEKLFELLNEFIKKENTKEVWKKKTEKLFNDKQDLTEFIIRLLVNYPESLQRHNTI